MIGWILLNGLDDIFESRDDEVIEHELSFNVNFGFVVSCVVGQNYPECNLCHVSISLFSILNLLSVIHKVFEVFRIHLLIQNYK